MTYKHVAMAAGLFGMALAVPATAQEFANLSANLFGNETSGGGPAKNAGADFNGEADLSANQLCYYFEAYGLSGITGASINEGGKNGMAVVPLQVGKAGSDEVCTDVDAKVLAAMAKKPGRYTVVIYTTEFPDGALSAKLAD